MKLRTLAICALLLGALACSRGAVPTAPGMSPGKPDIQASIGLDSTGRALFGVWMMEVSSDHAAVNAVPVRLGEGHFNVRTFLENGPCATCLSVVGVHPQGNGVLDVDVRLTHPFIGLDRFTGFDVRGTVIFPATSYWPANGLSWSRAADGGGELLNPDGFTTLFNPIDFEQHPGDPAILTYQKGTFATVLENPSTLNAYRAFYVEPDRRPFYASDAITKTYSIKLPAGPFRFGYVVDASWAKPDPNPPVNVPEDFPIEANCREAYRVSAHVEEGLNVSGGIATCEIDVYDWQGTSTVSLVAVEAPDLFAGTAAASLKTDYGSISRWEAQIQNDKADSIDDYPVLVRVDDATEDEFLGPVSAYRVITAHVGPASQYPDGIYVDRDYPGLAGGFPEIGTPDAPFTQINSAILVANAEQDIYIDPSPDPYNEQVSLHSERYLLGWNWRDDGDSGQPVVEAMDFDSSIYGIAVSDVTLDNLEVRPGGDLDEEFLYGIFFDYADPYAHQKDVTVKNCTFTGDRVHTGNETGDEIVCCQVYLTDNFTFEDNLITDCHVGSDQGGYFGGLHVDVCDGVKVRGNVITQCTFRNSFLGMHIWYSDLPVLVEDNEVSWMNNSDTPTGFTIGWAINVIGYSDVTVRHNTVHDLGGPGHRLETVGLFFRCVGDTTYYNWSIENNLIYNLYSQDAANTTNSADCRGIMFRMNNYNNLDGLRIANNTLVGLTSGEYVHGLSFDIGSGNFLYNYAIENNIIKGLTGPAQPDDYETSGAVYAYWPDDDLLIEYTLFDDIDLPDPMFYGVDEGTGNILDQDPMFDPAWHFPIGSPAQLGDPTFLDFDDPGPPSGDPDDPDPDTRSRMGAYGGPGGDW